MELTVTIFQRRRGRHYEWHTLGLGEHNRSWTGANLAKVESGLTESLRRSFVPLYPEAIAGLEIVTGRRLQVVTLSLSTPSGGSLRRIHGQFPLVIEPRPRGSAVPGDPLHCVFHPMRPTEWFALPTGGDLAELAGAFFRIQWHLLDEDEIAPLYAHSRDRLRLLAFSFTPKSLLAKLDKKKPAEGMTLLSGSGGKKGAALLSELAVDETRRAIDGRLPSGMPRRPLRDRLLPMISGRRRASVVLVGPSGSGKSMLIRQLVHDLLAADDYPSHRNYDKLQPVFRIAGRRIIAGMSYLGQWEQRCVDVVEAAAKARAVLWIEDIHAWGQLGETRESERSLATFFRGPVARGELAVIAECTTEQYQQLLDDAPTFAAALTTLFVEPTDPEQTKRMLVHQARALELQHRVAFDPRALSTIYALASTLGSGSAFPGRALDLLRSLATGDDVRSLDLRRVESEARAGRKIHAIKAYRDASELSLKAAKEAVEMFMARGLWPHRTTRVEPPPPVLRSALAKDFGTHAGPSEIGPSTVVRRLAARTGMPAVLVDASRPLAADAVRCQLAAQIMGQDPAVDAVCQLILRIKAGLTDPTRPWGVLLLSGPTGTGKTEMAKCLAEYLYGSITRLLRFDMSEYSDAGAAARLIGDRASPEGTLTSQVRIQPFCVVLLDEVEKADPSVLGLMLQLFDDGRLTDATGNLVDFTHVVVVMTSNLGASAAPSVGFGKTTVASAGDVDGAIREFFPPELFNRIDRVVHFDALSQDAARLIARRELQRLVARRGLTERNIYIRFTPSVVEHVVTQAFDPRYGARSLKRWLEDHIGAWLADEIAAQPVAGLRVLWLHTRGGALALHPELLTEAQVAGDPGPFEDMLDWNADALRGRMPDALEQLDRLLASPKLEALCDGLHARLGASVAGDQDAADAVFNLESLRSELTALRRQLSTQVEYDPRIIATGDADARADHDGELLEAERYSRLRIAGELSGEVFVRVLSPHLHGPALPLRQRPQFVEALAAFYFIRLAIDTADDPAQHTVLLELTRVTKPERQGRFADAGPGLLEWLADAYMRARGTVESIESQPPKTQATVLEGGAERLVVRIVGPAVRAFFSGEHGSHVRTSLAGGAEVVRVRVLPGDATPATHARDFEEARANFTHALESGATLPDNPDAVLPIVRRYHFDPAPGEVRPIEIEDYPLAYAVSTRARTLAEVLPQLWLLRVGLQAHPEVG